MTNDLDRALIALRVSRDHGHGTVLNDAEVRALLAEIDRLTRERDEHARWRAKLADDLHDRETQIIELRRQLDEAEQDARRYRDWLRGGENIPPESTRWARWEVRHWDGRHWNTLFAEALDTSIDAAMGGGDAG